LLIKLIYACDEYLGVIKMFIVPRTPASPRRLTPISMVSSPSISSPSISSPSISPKTQSASPTSFRAEKDVYDRFIDIYFNNDLKVQSLLLKTIIDFVGHPAYAHILRTMDKDNAHHVMGYLRSQRSVEMYLVLDQILRNPLPTKQDFYLSICSY
jgi:hypothetical protein